VCERGYVCVCVDDVNTKCSAACSASLRCRIEAGRPSTPTSRFIKSQIFFLKSQLATQFIIHNDSISDFSEYLACTMTWKSLSSNEEGEILKSRLATQFTI